TGSGGGGHARRHALGRRRRRRHPSQPRDDPGAVFVAIAQHRARAPSPPNLLTSIPQLSSPHPALRTARRSPHRTQLSEPTIEGAPQPMDRTLILVKPDAFARGLSGEIIARFERKGLSLVALRHMTVTRELAERHYAEHAERPFFGELVEFITSGPIVAMVLEGVAPVKAARQVIGATNPLEAAPGSIRGDFAIEMGQNMVHGSDSPESAAPEGAAVFPSFSTSTCPRG